MPGYVSPLPMLSTVALEVAKGRWPNVELFPNQMMLDLYKHL